MVWVRSCVCCGIGACLVARAECEQVCRLRAAVSRLRMLLAGCAGCILFVVSVKTPGLHSSRGSRGSFAFGRLYSRPVGSRGTGFEMAGARACAHRLGADGPS